MGANNREEKMHLRQMRLQPRLPGPRTICLTSLTLFLLYHFQQSKFNFHSQWRPSLVEPSRSIPETTKQPEEPASIPKKIWYKLGPKGLSDEARGWTQSCISQNPDFQVEFLSDASAEEFVVDKFSNRPDIVSTYTSLQVPILKVDFLKYLILWAEGGIWFDLDAECQGIPIDEWVPDEAKEANIVVGWEFDGGYHFDFQRQFATWTILAKKSAPHLMVAIEDVMQSLTDLARQHSVEIAGIQATMVENVIELTGPIRFERSVMKELQHMYNRTFDQEEEFHEILEPKMAGDVLILPGYALAASYNTYEPEDQPRVGPSLVVHHYAGSWKNDFGGEQAIEINLTI